MSEKKKSQMLLPVIASLTLGLAPFFPEPHLVKQGMNILNGTFTNPMDWFDLLFHGAPWGWLVYTVVSYIRSRG